MENFRLKVFRTVARTLNFRKAAEALLISQPAVTQQIRTLEEEVGTGLFDRTGGRIALTPSGAVLLEFAERLKMLSDEALQALAEVSGRGHDELRVAASQTIGQYLLPGLMAAFLRQQGPLQIISSGGNTDEVLQQLADQQVDLALIEGPSARPDVKSVAFLQDEMVLIVPPRHIWAGAAITVDQLHEFPLLSRELGSGSRRVVEAALRDAGLRDRSLQYAFTFDSTEGLLSAVEAGLGVAFVSQWAVRNQLALGTLQLSRVRGLQLSRPFAAAYRAGPPPQGSAGAFYRFLLSGAEAAVSQGKLAAKSGRNTSSTNRF